MREIKFRGKDREKWYYGDLLKSSDKTYIHLQNTFQKQNEMTATSMIFEVIPKTVGQCTGLKDSNGTKIYEGDILELSCKEGKWQGVVTFGNPYAHYTWGWEVYNKDMKKIKLNPDILLWVEMEEGGTLCEVIGNIYDNPELLK